MLQRRFQGAHILEKIFTWTVNSLWIDAVTLKHSTHWTKVQTKHICLCIAVISGFKAKLPARSLWHEVLLSTATPAFSNTSLSTARYDYWPGCQQASVILRAIITATASFVVQVLLTPYLEFQRGPFNSSCSSPPHPRQQRIRTLQPRPALSLQLNSKPWERFTRLSRVRFDLFRTFSAFSALPSLESPDQHSFRPWISSILTPHWWIDLPNPDSTDLQHGLTFPLYFFSSIFLLSFG